MGHRESAEGQVRWNNLHSHTNSLSQGRHWIIFISNKEQLMRRITTNWTFVWVWLTKNNTLFYRVDLPLKSHDGFAFQEIQERAISAHRSPNSLLCPWRVCTYFRNSCFVTTLLAADPSVHRMLCETSPVLSLEGHESSGWHGGLGQSPLLCL